MATWENSDGLVVRFDKSQGVRGNRGAVTPGSGKERELTLTFDLVGAARTLFNADNNNDGTLDGFNGLDTPLPSGAKIVGVQYRTVTTPAGGTSWQVGTFAADGTADDDDGILTTAQAAGAQVGTQISADKYVTAKTVGTYTAGVVQVVIRYIVG